MNKKIIQLLAGALLMMFYTSCTNEELVEERFEGIKLHINSDSGKTRASVDPGNNVENKIANMAVWFFQSVAEDSSKPVLYHLESGLDVYSDYDIEFTNQELEAAKMSSTGTYDIYVVALPADKISSVANITTLKQLKDMVHEGEYESVSKDGRPASPFIMSGQLLQCDFKKSNTAAITLVRVAVKLHITYTDNTGYGLGEPLITIENDLKNVGIFTPISDKTKMNRFTSGSICQVTTGSGIAYINEYLDDAEPVLIKVHATGGGKDYDWEVPIRYNGEQKLYRNTSYELHLTLNSYGATVALTPQPWQYSGVQEEETVFPEK